MNGLRAYWVMFKFADWACMVVAFNRSQAKQVFWRDNPAGRDSWDSGDYTDIRARLARQARIPDDIETPRLFDGCNDAEWICDASDPGAFCFECPMPGAKAKAAEVRNEAAP